MAIATASNWLWNFLIGSFTPFITGDIDFAYGYVSAGFLFVAVFVVYFFVLESKGKTLEEIDMMYVMRVRASLGEQEMDQRAARNIANEEESSKRNQGPTHEHIDHGEAGVGRPSA
ncbi:hypothetical protein BJX70DRAFT_401756 [Aspergillus crustosus]